MAKRSHVNPSQIEVIQEEDVSFYKSIDLGEDLHFKARERSRNSVNREMV